jgi:hypothetical protein
MDSGEAAMSDQAGVLFNPPPVGPIMDAANRIAIDAAAKLPAGAKGGIFSVITTQGVNAVIVHKANEHFTIGGYIGKQWGQPLEGGAAAVLTW